MIANFFQSLNAAGAEYLLISGQATVLYGAATFSEDIDLWLEPTDDNWERLHTALRACGGRYYKLTPPPTAGLFLRGHGFHYVFGTERELVFLDVMGKPPRTGSFAVAKAGARLMPTEWGDVLTVGLKELVEIKKTQRLEDYPIISRLALAWFDQPGCEGTESDFRWALQNIFTLPELALFFTEHPEAVALAGPFDPHVMEFGRQLRATGDVAEPVEQMVRALFQNRIASLQVSDRSYWRGIIGELKALRAEGKLMPEGGMV